MSDEPVLDWDRVIHKNVRASDGEPAGTIVAVDNKGVHIESGRRQNSCNNPKVSCIRLQWS
ncbi:MAG: hypothetical protein ACJ70V_03325 [Nitrososphaera sp.]